MGNSSSDRSSGGQGDRYRDGQPGGKEARAKILLDTTEDGDPDPKVRYSLKVHFFFFVFFLLFKLVKQKISTLTFIDCSVLYATTETRQINQFFS